METLSTSLTSAASTILTAEKDLLLPLRNLKDEILKPYLAPSFAPDLRFVAFSLANFLDDVFYNLTGDFPDQGKIIHEICEGFFKTVAAELGFIGELLSKGNEPLDREAVWKVLARLVCAYLDTIDRLNVEFLARIEQE